MEFDLEAEAIMKMRDSAKEIQYRMDALLMNFSLIDIVKANVSLGHKVHLYKIVYDRTDLSLHQARGKVQKILNSDMPRYGYTARVKAERICSMIGEHQISTL